MTTRIINGQLVTENGVTRQDLAVRDGKICAIGAALPAIEGETCIDAAGKLIFPGMIDSHVHYYAPCGDGYTVDDFRSGTTGAVCGGVTTIVDYAFPRPGMDLRQSLEARKREAQGYSFCDYTFHSEIMGEYGFSPEALVAVREAGILSLKGYTTYGADQLTYPQFEELMRQIKPLGLRLTVHAEDDAVCQREKERCIVTGQCDCSCHAKSRPGAAEVTAVEKLLALAEKTGAGLHIVHVSTGEAAARIAAAKKCGVDVTCETCPHYLLLTEACYRRPDGAAYIMTPPLRTARDNEQLWQRVCDGTINSIVSDHCAFPLQEKLAAKSCFAALPGIPGTETIFPLLYTEGRRRGLTVQDIVRLFSAEPARLFGLYPRKGCLAVGSDADLFMLDPEARGTLTWKDLHSRSGYTVYEGWETEGRIELVMRRGKIIMRHGRMQETSPGGVFLPCCQNS